MGEDISAAFRLSITLLILAASIVAVVAIFSSVYSQYNVYTEKLNDALGDSGDVSLVALEQERCVPAPVVYRIVYQNIDKIGELKIAWKDGVITSDYNTLLKNAASFMEVTVDTRGDGAYKVSVVELTE